MPYQDLNSFRTAFACEVLTERDRHVLIQAYAYSFGRSTPLHMTGTHAFLGTIICDRIEAERSLRFLRQQRIIEGGLPESGPPDMFRLCNASFITMFGLESLDWEQAVRSFARVAVHQREDDLGAIALQANLHRVIAWEIALYLKEQRAITLNKHWTGILERYPTLNEWAA